MHTSPGRPKQHPRDSVHLSADCFETHNTVYFILWVFYECAIPSMQKC